MQKEYAIQFSKIIKKIFCNLSFARQYMYYRQSTCKKGFSILTYSTFSSYLLSTHTADEDSIGMLTNTPEFFVYQRHTLVLALNLSMISLQYIINTPFNSIADIKCRH